MFGGMESLVKRGRLRWNTRFVIVVAVVVVIVAVVIGIIRGRRQFVDFSLARNTSCLLQQRCC